VAEQLSPAADAAGVTIGFDATDAPVQGDAVLLRSLVENVLRNAVAYNRPGGSVAIAVGRRGDEAWMGVENTGRLLDVDEVSMMLRPFARGAQDAVSTPGTGIGMAVVQAVAAAHGGRFTAVARTGGGLVTDVFLPGA